MNIYWVIMEDTYGAVDADDSTCNCYYIIRFHLSRYNLQEDFSIDVQVISSGEMVCEGTYFFQSIPIPIIIIVFSKTKSISTIVSLRKIINVNINIICYGSKDFVTSFLRSISKKYFSTLSTLHITM